MVCFKSLTYFRYCWMMIAHFWFALANLVIHHTVCYWTIPALPPTAEHITLHMGNSVVPACPMVALVDRDWSHLSLLDVLQFLTRQWQVRSIMIIKSYHETCGHHGITHTKCAILSCSRMHWNCFIADSSMYKHHLDLLKQNKGKLSSSKNNENMSNTIQITIDLYIERINLLTISD